MRKPEQARGERQGIAAKPFRVRAPGEVPDAQQVAFQMRPTELRPAFVILQIRSKTVAAQNAWENRPQQVNQNLGTAAGGHREEDERTGHQRPQPAAFSHAAPAGLIAIQHWLFRQLLLQFLAGHRQCLAGFFDELLRAPQADFNVQRRLQQFFHAAAWNPEPHGKIGDQPCQAGAEDGFLDLCGKFGPGGLAALRADYLVGLILRNMGTQGGNSVT
jgi:hypothetical protein